MKPMNITINKIISILFAVIIIAGFSTFLSSAVDDTDRIKSGDIIEYGSYPKSLVSSGLGRVLNMLPGEWKPYDYKYKDSHGKTCSGDMVYYKDVTYGGYSYRGILIKRYRPYNADRQAVADSSYVDDNGFFKNSTFTFTYYSTVISFEESGMYWFKYDPIEWIVLDAESGLMVTKDLIDAQPFSETYSSSAKNDYEKSGIRNWLGNDFLNTAFTKEQKENIEEIRLSKEVENGQIPFETKDKIFLLSKEEYEGYTADEQSPLTASKRGLPTDYAASQGIKIIDCVIKKDNRDEYYECSNWYLRSHQEGTSRYVYGVGTGGSVGTYGLCSSTNGIRPACFLNELKSDTTTDNKDIVFDKEDNDAPTAAADCSEVFSTTLNDCETIGRNVKLNFSDDAAVAGYYFGKDKTPSLKNITLFDNVNYDKSRNIEWPVGSGGTYYYYCVDFRGQFSPVGSVTFDEAKFTWTQYGIGNVFCKIASPHGESISLPNGRTQYDSGEKKHLDVVSYKTTNADGKNVIYYPGDTVIIDQSPQTFQGELNHEFSFHPEIITDKKGDLVFTVKCEKCDERCVYPKKTTKFNLVESKAPTCKKAGYNTYEVSTKGIFSGEVTAEITQRLPAAHSYKYKITKEPTYTAKGEKTGTCTVCGATTKESIAKLKAPTVAKVSGLKASKVDTNAVTIKWSKAKNADKFEVYKSTDGKKWAKIATTKKLTYSDKDVKPGTKYQYKIRGIHSASKAKGEYSSVLKTGTLTAAPKISKLTSTKSKTATVTWGKAKGAKSYIVYTSTDGKKFTKATTTTKTTVTLSKLTAGKKVYMKVAAVNAYGKKSANSSAKSVTVKK